MTAYNSGPVTLNGSNYYYADFRLWNRAPLNHNWHYRLKDSRSESADCIYAYCDRAYTYVTGEVMGYCRYDESGSSVWAKLVTPNNKAIGIYNGSPYNFTVEYSSVWAGFRDDDGVFYGGPTLTPTYSRDGVSTSDNINCGLLTGTISVGGASVSKDFVIMHNLVGHDAVPSKCTASGSLFYTTCINPNEAGLYFSDGYGLTPVDYSALVVPPLGHNFSLFHAERREYPCQNGCGIVKIPCYKGVINSICRPVEGKLSYDTDETLPSSKLTPVYDFSGIVGRKVYGVSVPQTSSSLETAHPYIFVPAAGSTEADPDDETGSKGYVYFHADEPHYYTPYPAEDKERGNGGIRNGMYGALQSDIVNGYDDGPEHVYRESPEGENINCLKIKKSKEHIIFRPDGLHYCDIGNNYLTFGKCFLKSEEVPYSPSAARPVGAKEIGVFFDGEDEGELPTGVRGVAEGGTRGSGAEAAYNLRGQRVGSDYKGIVVIGGHKMIRR